MHGFPRFFPGLGLAFFVLAANPAPAGDPPPKPSKDDWQKFTTQDSTLPQGLYTPMLADPSLARTVELSAGEKGTDLGLPHAGKGKDGKPLGPLLAALTNAGAVWVDTNLNGTGEVGEIMPVHPQTQEAGTFSYLSSHEDGTSGAYLFRLRRMIGAKNKFRLLRAGGKSAQTPFGSLLILDENGNGLFNDQGHDVVVADRVIVTLLSKYIHLGGRLYEIMVSPSGSTVELLPAQNVTLSRVDLFRKFSPIERGTDLKFAFAIVKGASGAFGFSSFCPVLDLPAGSYEPYLAVFQRGTEAVAVKGGKSFEAEANKGVAPAWGEPLKVLYTVSYRDLKIDVGELVVKGSAGEVYEHLNPKMIGVEAHLLKITPVSLPNANEMVSPLSTQILRPLPEGGWTTAHFDVANFLIGSSERLRVVLSIRCAGLGAHRVVTEQSGFRRK